MFLNMQVGEVQLKEKVWLFYKYIKKKEPKKSLLISGYIQFQAMFSSWIFLNWFA